MSSESAISRDARIGGLVDGRYRVLEAMAAGSMGAVYKAERIPVGKLVAIKFLHAPFASDEEFLGRFERETRVMSKLTHPNCVSVVDFGVWDGAPYLVMEFVAGTTLRQLIDGGALPVKRALNLVRQITAGLAHAHAQGIVHRDVKPANIMISEEIGTGDHVRILDFGLARLRGAVGRDSTQSNVVVGTPNYMAPEQTVGGGLIDVRTDIYAVGVVLFEMITGDRPFQAEDTLTLLGMHRAAPIPKLIDRIDGNAVLPRGLQAIIDKAMAKSPSDRFQSAIELAEAIDQVAASIEASGIRAGDVDPRRSVEAKRAGSAPTVLAIEDEDRLDASSRSVAGTQASRSAQAPQPRPRRSALGSLILFAIILGGVATAAWWLHDSGPAPTVATAPSAPPAPPATPAPPAPPSADPVSATSPGSAQPAAAGSSSDPVASAAAIGSGSAGSGEPAGSAAGSGEPSSSGQGSGSAIGSAASVTGSAAPSPGSGEPGGRASAGSGQGSGSAGSAGPGPGEPAGTPEAIELDPTKADDPAPASARPIVDDEAVNAPKNTEEAQKAEKRARAAPAAAPQAAPALATSVTGAVQLIRDGKHDLALASLEALWKKDQSSSYIPFLLGNLYFDRQWWSVAMEHYAIAIKKNARYRNNEVLNKNVIRMLASNKTSRKAEIFLRTTIGKPAIPYLKAASQRDANPQVKRLAAWVIKGI